MLYMVIERFPQGVAPVGDRFKSRGRMMPDGLTYHSSWIDEGGTVCFQIMETSDVALLDEWMANWADLVDFEVMPVVTSATFWELQA
jgi:hypothetical protein